MDYEKAYKESFEAAKGLHEAGNALTKKQMEIVFPQLAESEDERITRAINNMLPFIPDEAYANNGVTKEDILAWLEKQKEEDGYEAIPIESTLEYKVGKHAGFLEGLNEGRKQKESHYTKRNALFDKCVEDCDPKVMKEVSDKVDAILEKEQKPAEIDDFEIIKKHITEDSLSSEVNKRLKECGWYVTDEKPAQTNDEKEYIRTIKGIIADFIRDKKPEDVGYYQRIYDWLDGRHIEQKPAEWDELQAEFRNINEAFEDGKKEVIGNPEKYGLCKPAEWSEEDKLMIKCCERALEFYRINAQRNKKGISLPAQFDISGYIASPEKVESWLKSLRPQSHWKPSEEQMRAFRYFINQHQGLANQMTSNWTEFETFKSLYEQPKKLM